MSSVLREGLAFPVIPTCFKQTTIVPVPKKAKVTCLNDYRPVALMSVGMKCFERLVMAQHHQPINPLPTLIRIPPKHIHRRHNLQFTPDCPFPPGQKETYVRMVFIDYSSVFNTIVPS